MSQFSDRDAEPSGTYGKQLSRDLHWIQNSPVLFNSQCNNRFSASILPNTCHPLFQAGYALPQQETARIYATLQNKRWHLLGIYYETLWHYLLKQHPSLNITTTNLQVQKADKSTLGEFDLIYNDKETNDTIHLELAVKFYLGVPGTASSTTIVNNSPWNMWVGPGLKDRMDRKLQRLLNHQITLSQTREGQKTLEALGINKVVRSICLQGYLFYPVHGHCSPPENCNPDHLKGYWVTEPKLHQWLKEQQQPLHFFCPTKLRWLSCLYVCLYETADQQPYDISRLCQAMKSIVEPKLVAACMKMPDGYYEQFRFFVVPDFWQEKATTATKNQP